MNWLEYNHVRINCFSKSKKKVEQRSTKQLKQLARDGILMFSSMASLSIENQVVSDKLQIV